MGGITNNGRQPFSYGFMFVGDHPWKSGEHP